MCAVISTASPMSAWRAECPLPLPRTGDSQVRNFFFSVRGRGHSSHVGCIFWVDGIWLRKALSSVAPSCPVDVPEGNCALERSRGDHPPNVRGCESQRGLFPRCLIGGFDGCFQLSREPGPGCPLPYHPTLKVDKWSICGLQQLGAF